MNLAVVQVMSARLMKVMPTFLMTVPVMDALAEHVAHESCHGVEYMVGSTDCHSVMEAR